MGNVIRRWSVVLVFCALVATAVASGPPAAQAAPHRLTAASSLTQDWATSTPVGSYNVRILSETFSSPAVGDVTGDSAPEIVVGSNSGKILIYDTSGTLIRSFFADDHPTSVLSTPALADLNGDGKLDIVVGMMPVSDANATSTVAAFNGAGVKLWGRKTCGLGSRGACDVFASPAIGDVDGDGSPDVVVASQDSYVYALRGSTGANLPGWPFFLYDSTWSSAAIVDLDRNGSNEVVIASDLDVSTCRDNAPVQPCSFGGEIHILNGNGTERVRRNIPGEVVFSSPAVGDINGDGRPDIVVGSGFYFLTQGQSDIPSRKVQAYDLNLNPLPGWPVQLGGRSMASPALADVDGNGSNEVVTMAEDGRVTVLNGNGSVRWSQCNRNGTNPCDQVNFSMNSSPVVADIDNDGRQEVLADSEHSLRAFDANTGTVEWSKLLWSGDRQTFANAATPSVASINGKARVFVHGLVDVNKNGARDNADADSLWSFSSSTALGPSAWPVFRQNPAHTGSALGPVDLATTPGGRYVIHAYKDLLGRTPTSAELRTGVNALNAFGRRGMAQALVFSPEWAGHVVHDLYVAVLGREPDAGGLAYWTNEVKNGRTARSVAILFYSSPEYYQDKGGTPEAYVDAIYTAILGRAPDAGGRAYWIGQVSSRGQASVARDFYQSPESRTLRVTNLYRQLLKRAPDPGGRDYWAGRLLKDDDLVLALNLVTSDEYVFFS